MITFTMYIQIVSIRAETKTFNSSMNDIALSMQSAEKRFHYSSNKLHNKLFFFCILFVKKLLFFVPPEQKKTCCYVQTK